MTMAVRSVVLLLVGFSGLLGMQGCGSMHTITFLSMAAPSVASDEYQPSDQKKQKLLAKMISGREQPSADGADGRKLIETLDCKRNCPLF